jgi:hypothetical protein
MRRLNGSTPWLQPFPPSSSVVFVLRLTFLTISSSAEDLFLSSRASICVVASLALSSCDFETVATSCSHIRAREVSFEEKLVKKAL